MNPYRLINKHEQKQLALQVHARLNQWNEQYALHPLNITLLSPNEMNEHASLSIIQDDDAQDIAGIESSMQELMTYCLFASDDLYFSAVTESLTLELLTILLGQQCLSSSAQHDASSWIYSGSPCLVLHLQCHQFQSAVWLSPNWVHHALPMIAQHRAPPDSLHNALDDKPLTLTLELGELSIPLNQLMHLHPGDVLVCDHQLNQPLYLKHQHQAIAKAELGHIDCAKSLIIKECS